MRHNNHPNKAGVIRIGFDATWLLAEQKTGVGYYIEGLVAALAATYEGGVTLYGFYFGPAPTKAQQVVPGVQLIRSRIPIKVVNALRRLGIELPVEMLLKQRVDFMLFPAYLTFPSIHKTPSAVVIHDLAYYDAPESVTAKNRKDLQRFVPKSIDRSTFIVTESIATKLRLEQVYNVTKPIVITGIPPSATVDFHDKAILELVGSHAGFILFLGTVEPRKNIDTLLTAYQQLPADLQAANPLVIAGGPGWNSQSTLRHIEGLQAMGLHIIQTGYISEAARATLLREASVFVLPSSYEGFGMPLLEAMAYRTPVVASNIAVFHEVCNDAALYFDPKDATDLSIMLARLLRSPSLQKKLIAQGNKNLKRFDWQASAAVVYDQIKQTLAV